MPLITYASHTYIFHIITKNTTKEDLYLFTFLPPPPAGDVRGCAKEDICPNDECPGHSSGRPQRHRQQTGVEHCVGLTTCLTCHGNRVQLWTHEKLIFVHRYSNHESKY